MKKLRTIFGVILLELLLLVIVGYLALDNNLCDASNPWHWSYVAAPVLNSATCPTINVSVASSEPRFLALELIVVSIPITAGYGYLVACKSERLYPPKVHESPKKH